MTDWHKVCEEATEIGKMFRTADIVDYFRSNNISNLDTENIRSCVLRVLRTDEKYGIYKCIQKNPRPKPCVWIRVR